MSRRPVILSPAADPVIAELVAVRRAHQRMHSWRIATPDACALLRGAERRLLELDVKRRLS